MPTLDSYLKYKRIFVIGVALVACITVGCNGLVILSWTGLNQDAQLDVTVECPERVSLGSEFNVLVIVSSSKPMNRLLVQIPPDTGEAFALVSVMPAPIVPPLQSFGQTNLEMGGLDAGETRTIDIVLYAVEPGIQSVGFRVWHYPRGRNVSKEIVVESQ